MANNYINLTRRSRFDILLIYFIAFISSILLVLDAHAFPYSGAVKPFKVDSTQLLTIQQLLQAMKPGERMPEEFWEMPMELDNFRGKKFQYTYGDMRGRVIIFDFWSTSCKSCIENFPHLSQIQEKYPDKLAIILVNSRRNKDTPGRISATVKRYKEQYNYDIGVFTILDDTVLTTLFPHNAIPSTAWINPDGIYMGNTLSDAVNEKNIQSVLKTGKADLSLVQVYRNFDDRRKTPLLRDTVGVEFISELTDYNPFYLPTYANVIHKNGHSSYQMVNNYFSAILSQAYRKELDGLSWSDFVFDTGNTEELKYKLLNSLDTKNAYSYQLFVRDSINQTKAEAYLRKAFDERFNLKVERKKGEIEVYEVRYNEHFEKTKSKGEMSILQPYPGADPEQYRNVSVSLFLGNLFYYLDRPLVFDRNDAQAIDVVLPADFGQRTMASRLAYLAQCGIELIPRRMTREYVYIASMK